MVAAVQPLYGLELGLDAQAIGLLIAVSAIAQISMRFALRWLIRAYPARGLILLADALLVLACGILAASASVVWFTVSQLLQGSSRAVFYTASQAQVLRQPNLAREISLVVFAASLGSFVAPLAAGVLASFSFAIAFAVSGATALIALIPGGLMSSQEPFRVGRNRRKGLWREPAVRLGCGSAAVAGAWKGLMDSYVPVALSQGGLPPAAIGLFLSFGTGFSIVGSGLAGAVKRRIGRLARGCIVGVPIGIALSTMTRGSIGSILVGLAISGGAAGVLQSLAPVLGAGEVGPDQRGEVIALTGLWRAFALFGSPLGVSVLLVGFPLSSAVAIVGMTCSIAAIGSGPLVRWSRSR
jgi:hypothetical protein